MLVAPGTHLLHYRLVEKIGAGGMGVVWRAVDTTLEREVAVKILPDLVAGDAERLARFEREAKTLASLNHPNVAAVYGFHDAAGTRFLAMELVRGEDLSARIARGPLPLPEALAIALRIAEALEYAHEHGIVHRDLKPANVKVGADGAVKVLDFGLAKALDPPAPPGSTSLSHSPTMTAAATVAGLILGTAAYMSPEQAAGKTADRRADVWSFGVVLHEMLSGHGLFDGETVSHVLAAVLKDEPDWGALRGKVPARVLELLQRCLQKKRERRLQSIGDARVLLEEWVTEPASLAPDAGPAERRSALPWLAALVAAALSIGGVLGWIARPAPVVSAAPMWLPLTFAEGQALDLDESHALALSPDGRRLAFVAASGDGLRQLLLRDLDAIEPRVLQGTADAQAPFFSPDGEWVGFFTGRELAKIAVAGGPPVTVVAAGGQSRGATWSDDGSIYYTDSAVGGLKRVAASGGEPAPFTEVDERRKERTHRWPCALPGGRAVLFTSDTFETTEFYDDARIEAVVRPGGERRVVLERASRAQYMPPNQLVFARAGSLYAVEFDPVTLETRGEPVLVLQGVATDASTGAVHYGLSREGTLLYVPGDATSGSQEVVWIDRQGRVSSAGPEPGHYDELTLSPDGRRVALLSGVGPTGGLAVWVADLERGTLSRLTFDGVAGEPVWSSDGTRIAYSLSHPDRGSGGPDIYWKPADGSGEAEPLLESDVATFPIAFSPDGKLLAIDRPGEGAGSDVWILPLEGKREPWPFTSTPFDEYSAEFSPDGRFLAYASDESGRAEIYMRPFPAAGAGRWQISTNGGMEPHFSADGRQIFYREGDALFGVPIDTSAGFVAGRAAKLFDGVQSGGNPRSYSVAPDGSRFLTLRTLGGESRQAAANLVVHWDADVRRRLAR